MVAPVFAETIDTVLFDFDGTLVDASDAICASFRAAVDHDPAVTDDVVRAMIGRPLREMFTVVRPAAQTPELDRLVERYRAVFLPLSATTARTMPGASETIRRLARSARLGIVTTRLAEGAVRMLRAHDLLDSFSCIVGIEHVDRPKPDAEPVERALFLLRSSARSTVMVGDTPDDILAGRRAGTYTIGITTGAFGRDALMGAGADHVIGSLFELPDLIHHHTLDSIHG